VAGSVNLVGLREIRDGMRVEASIRYRDRPSSASLYRSGDGGIRLLFDQPKRAITPGQSVVLYEGERLLGGGVIERATD
jgi:tRNA-specific 2-thiouridylase